MMQLLEDNNVWESQHAVVACALQYTASVKASGLTFIPPQL